MSAWQASAKQEAVAPNFCCRGCELVYQALHECGLDAYYELRDASPGRSLQLEAPDAFASFDDPAFHARFVRTVRDDLLEVDLVLSGVHCSACLWVIEQLPALLAGVQEARLDLARALVRVRFAASEVKLSAIAAKLNSLGYVPSPFEYHAQKKQREQEDRALLIKIAVAGACMGNVMLMAFAMYAGADGFEHYGPTFSWLSLLVTLPAVGFSATPFYRGALAALRTWRPHMDLPIAVGVTLSFLGSAYGTVSGQGEIYYDSTTAIIFLLLSGRFLQRREQSKAQDICSVGQRFLPATAKKVESDGVRAVSALALMPGDVLEVKADDVFPTDATVISGDGNVDLAILTGESNPTRLQPGDEAPAGATLVSGCLLVRVKVPQQDSRMGQLLRRIQGAGGQKPALLSLTDRIAGAFTLGVLALASGVGVYFLMTQPDVALNRVVAILVVTCPCALGLAVPLAMSAAMSRAVQRGILVKNPTALQFLGRNSSIVFDKTGTLTMGAMHVVHIHGLNDTHRKIVGLLEMDAGAHPVARALRAWASEGSTNRETQAGSEEELKVVRHRQGVEGWQGDKYYALGSRRFLVERGVSPAELEEFFAEGEKARPNTKVGLACDGQLVGGVELGDSLRPEARPAVVALRHKGFQVYLSSGDDVQVARHVGEQLGLPHDRVFGEMSAEDKERFIQQLKEQHPAPCPTVMVGDGVNDAPALLAADLGIAMRGGAEPSLQAADVFLQSGSAWDIVALDTLAQRLSSLIRQNVVTSLVYNGLTVTLTCLGYVGPLEAAILMPISSIWVVSRSASYDYFKTRKQDAQQRPSVPTHQPLRLGA